MTDTMMIVGPADLAGLSRSAGSLPGIHATPSSP